MRAEDLPFRQQVEPHRPEILRHCYRLLGSWTEAEDLAQEVMLRAWRGLERFDQRASTRTWLYRIATNAGLTQLEKRRRRSLPELAGPAARGPVGPPVAASEWIGPAPDERETITLAFVLALQELSPRQRAVLLLRDVVGFEAPEVAQMLGMTLHAANSLLARARARLAGSRTSDEDSIEPARLDADQRRMLQRYVRAWETGDVDGLIALLSEDAHFSMPPISSWYRGRARIARVLRGHVFEGGHRFLLQSSRANGRPAFIMYWADRGDPAFRPHGVQLVALDGTLVSNVTTFLEPRLVGSFGFPGVARKIPAPRRGWIESRV